VWPCRCDAFGDSDKMTMQQRSREVLVRREVEIIFE
jgi:hypothetical protein